MREQIELIKNLRDTNWIQFRSWDSIELAKISSELDSTLKTNNYYIIANSFVPGKTTRIEKISTFPLNEASIAQEFNKNPSKIHLCTDILGRYVHDCSGGNKNTQYASFFKIEPLVTKNTLSNTTINVDRGYKVTVFFVSFNK